MRPPASILLLILPIMLIALPTAMAGAPPPEGKTYFVVVMGLNGDPYVPAADCLAFDATQACSLDDQICLTWQRTEGGLQTVKQSGFSFMAQINDDGLVITLDGQGRVDGRGKGSAISLSARAEALGMQVNFVVAGRQARPRRCLNMVEDFYESGIAAR